ncbi:MAG: hypothetical protein CVV18_00930 [Gammaproteobacteria bacterium HGW-Gammaproteobacteria-8]|nr:MAG: hypothetical protein CVV18_00930 [Gammaproteobacteria bacterium HGW-Gammaproteobacteria-8]
MLKLAYDFTRRAITTFRGQPIANAAERPFCEWGAGDLDPDLSSAGLSDDFDRLGASILGVASRYKHSRGRAFQDHLQGVARLLQRWEQDALIVRIGLFHSAYSTQQYPYGLYGYEQRDELRALIGHDTERLVFLFCSHDRVDLYAQAVELAKAGETLPEDGLELRNALTGSTACVPAELIAPLLVVHAADLAEQMDGFDFAIISALLACAQPWVKPPECLQLLRAAGVAGKALSIRIQAKRGSFGLVPVLGLNKTLLADRLRLARLLRGRGPLDDHSRAQLDALDQRLPGLFEVPWIRLHRDSRGNQARADAMLADARLRHHKWGVPWLKRPFDNNPSYRALIHDGASWPLSET